MIRIIGKYTIDIFEDINKDNYFKHSILITAPKRIFINSGEIFYALADTLRNSNDEEKIRTVLHTLAENRAYNLKELQSIL